MVRNKIKCELCGQLISLSNITKHKRRHVNHPESFKILQYKLNHNGLDCQFCGKTCKNRNSLCNHERMCKLNPNNQLLSSGFIKYNNEIRDGKRKSWNKGLTKETDVRVAKNAESVKQHYLNNNVSRKPLSEEHKKKISNTINEKVKNNQWHVSIAKNMHYKYKDVDLHGTWELKYAQYLDKNNIKWIRNIQKFKYCFNNKTHYYTPDFYLTDINTFIEIKGYKTAKDEAKWKDFPCDKILKILFYKDLKELNIL